jgi:hypothetical protein
METNDFGWASGGTNLALTVFGAPGWVVADRQYGPAGPGFGGRMAFIMFDAGLACLNTFRQPKEQTPPTSTCILKCTPIAPRKSMFGRPVTIRKMFSILCSSWNNLSSVGIHGSSMLVKQTKNLTMREAGRCPAFGRFALEEATRKWRRRSLCFNKLNTLLIWGQ